MICSWLIAGALAAPVDDDDYAEVVVVTAARSEQPISQAPVAIEVITRAEIDATGAESLAELLEEQPGLQVDNTIVGTSIRMQGMDPEHTLLLIDGQRVLGRKDGVIDLSRFALANVERIEIVKGPSSSLYGSDAMGGVVHIITRRPADEVEIGAHLRAGMFERVDASADVALATGPVRHRIGADWHSMAPWRFDPDAVATTASGYEQAGFDWRGALDPSADAHLDATASYMQRRLRGVSTTVTGGVIDDRAIVEEARAALSGWWTVGASTKLSARASSSLYRSQVIADQRGSSVQDTRADDREQLAEGALQLDHAAGEHFLSAGVDGLFQDLTTERLVDGKGARGRVALFAQDTWTKRRGALRLSAVPGARLDVDTQFGTAFTPRLALAAAGERATGRLSVGTGFRSPDFRELYLRFENPGVGYVIEGTPDLRPERSAQLAGGFELAPQKRVALVFSAYHNQIRDLIQFGTVPVAPGEQQRFAYDNIARASTTGFDSQLRLRPRPFELELAWAFVRAWDLDLDRALEGRVPHRVTGVVGVELPAAITVRAQGGWSSARPFYVGPDEARVDEPGRFTLDARLVREGDPLDVFVGIDNLTNAGASGLAPLMPRFVYVGIDFRGRRERG